MPLKKRTAIILFLLVIFALPVSAADRTAGKALSELTKTVFAWGIGLAASFAGISLAVGAVQYMTSAGNPATQKDATSRMLQSAVGLLLSLASVFILNTINPSIAKVEFGVPLANKFTGAYLSNGNTDEDTPATFLTEDSSAITEAGYHSILYFCDATTNAAIQPRLLVWFYPEKKLKDPGALYKNTTVKKLACNETAAISGKSFKIAYELSGVYFFLEKGCTGFQSEAQMPANEDVLTYPFKGNIRSVRLFNDKVSRDAPFGVIFHTGEKREGVDFCTDPFFLKTNDDCYEVKNILPDSADIFVTLGADTTDDRMVSLYSTPWGWQSGSGAGGYNVRFSKFENLNLARPFSYYCFGGRPCQEQEYKDACPDMKSCPGSIELIGDALIILSDDGNYGNRDPDLGIVSTCQYFDRNIISVKETRFIGEKNPLKSISVIPLE